MCFDEQVEPIVCDLEYQRCELKCDPNAPCEPLCEIAYELCFLDGRDMVLCDDEMQMCMEVCGPLPGFCGDGVCAPDEDPAVCSEDCAPPEPEICDDGVDNDGDGFVDCVDWDCAGVGQCPAEICDDGIDNDGDGWIDCGDFNCADDPFCQL